LFILNPYQGSDWVKKVDDDVFVITQDLSVDQILDFIKCL
jgi:hypothetical protein